MSCVNTALALILCLSACKTIGYDPSSSVDKFCANEPTHALCSGDATVPTKTPSLQEVRDINAAGNKQFTLHADVDEHWHTTGKLGDCEDYALWKYQKLHEAGYSPSLVIYTRFFGGYKALHAVTSVGVAGAEWILDNETSDIRKKSRTERIGAVVINGGNDEN